MTSKKEKIIAREVAPEDVDFSYFFDDLIEDINGDDFYSVYILSSTRSSGSFNKEQFDSILQEIWNIVDQYRYGETIESSLKYVLGEWEITSFLRNSLEDLETLANRMINKANLNDIEIVRDYLAIKTGSPWRIKPFHGYSQGEQCNILYNSILDEEYVEELGKYHFGCGTEFAIDGIAGYYVIDTIRWREGKDLAQELASQYGCDPDDLEIHLYIGEERITLYKIMPECDFLPMPREQES